MTEMEKMQQGLLYNASYDPDLTRQRTLCKDICHAFNQLPPSQKLQQDQLIQQLFGKVGDGLYITAPFWCDYGYNIYVGKNFYTNHNCVILDCAPVRFGDNVFIGPNCVFSTAGHPLNTQQRNQGLEYACPITVGDNVWFGAGVTVLPGVTIGSDTVIGAGSLVNRDIPSGVVAAGSPCRVLRPITPQDKEKYAK